MTQAPAPKMMVEVFRTNVTDAANAGRIVQLLSAQFPQCKFNFDLDDHDRIFRAVSISDISKAVIECFRQQHFQCDILP